MRKQRPGFPTPYNLNIGRWALGVRRFLRMRIDIVTLFPAICRTPLSESMMKRAQEKSIVDLHIHNLRDWTTDKHHVVDDAPFGGGQGMVMKPEPIFAAVEDLRKQTPNAERPTLDAPAVAAPLHEARVSPAGRRLRAAPKIILMSPAGHRFDQRMAQQLSLDTHL